MANYTIMRIEKRKLGSVGRIGNHHERLKAEYKSNPDIDPSRTHQNYHIVEPPSKYRKAVLDRIESVGAKRRKDSVVMQDCFVGGTPDWLKGKTVEEQRDYFDYAYRFFEDSFGKENIISAVVHLDETTPHMHLCFVPITADGRLSAKDILGNRKNLSKWQDEFWAFMVKKYPDLERGESASQTGRTHIPPRVFKEAAHLARKKEKLIQLLSEITPLNARKKAAEIEAFLTDYIPSVEKLMTRAKKANSAVKELNAEIAELKKEVNSNKASVVRQLELSRKVQELDSLKDTVAELQRPLEAIPQEILDEYLNATKQKPKENTQQQEH